MVAKSLAWTCGMVLLALAAGCTGPGSPDMNAGPWRFAMVADTQGTGIFDPVNKAAARAMAEAMVADDVDLVLVAGDLVYGTPVLLAWQFEVWRDAMDPLYRAGVKIYPVRGNHEASAGTISWKDLFDDLPQDGPAGEKGLTYSFVHHNALFIGLDEYVRPHRINQRYLDTQLNDPQRPAHVFVFGHEPAFLAGSAPVLSAYPDDRDALWNSLGAVGGMYLCGHNHLYARLSIADTAGRPVQQLIVGTGGGPSGTFSPYIDPRVQALFHDSGHCGYLLVQIDGDTVEVQYKAQLDPANPLEFTAIDQFTCTQPAPASQPAAAPGA